MGNEISMLALRIPSLCLRLTPLGGLALAGNEVHVWRAALDLTASHLNLKLDRLWLAVVGQRIPYTCGSHVGLASRATFPPPVECSLAR